MLSLSCFAVCVFWFGSGGNRNGFGCREGNQTPEGAGRGPSCRPSDAFLTCCFQPSLCGCVHGQRYLAAGTPGFPDEGEKGVCRGTNPGSWDKPGNVANVLGGAVGCVLSSGVDTQVGVHAGGVPRVPEHVLCCLSTAIRVVTRCGGCLPLSSPKPLAQRRHL